MKIYSLIILGVSLLQSIALASNLVDRHSSVCSDRNSCQDTCDDLFSSATERSKCYELSYDEVNTISSVCSDRDSCQDICDDLFSYTTERYNCYELSSDEVNTISKVSDELEHREINSNELEDLDADDVRAYLEIGMDSFIDLIKGEAVGDDAKENNAPQWGERVSAPSSNRRNSAKILVWIAENEDIAEVILEQDRNFELGLELFQAVGVSAINPSTWEVSSGLHVCLNASTSTVDHGGDNTCGNMLLGLNHFDKVSEFLSGFILPHMKFSDDSFITFATHERNATSFEWGHKTLLGFCKEAIDEDESDIEVKTCLQTAYCVHRAVEGQVANNGDGIFKDLKDYDDIVGRTDEEYCEDLDNEERIARLFD